METKIKLNVPHTWTPRLRVHRVFWLVFLVLPALYAGLSRLMLRASEPKPFEAFQLMAVALGVISALILIVVIPILRRAISPPSRAPRPGAADAELALSEGAVRSIAKRYFVVTVLSLALCLAVTIYGLVITNISGWGELIYPFIIASWLGMLAYAPRASTFHRMLLAKADGV